MQHYEKTFHFASWQYFLQNVPCNKLEHFCFNGQGFDVFALYAKPYSITWKVQCTCMASDTVQGAPGVSHPSVYLLTSLLITYK